MLQGLIDKLAAHRKLVRQGGVILIIVSVLSFNALLCTRILAPHRKAALLVSILVPMIALALIVANEVVRRRRSPLPIEYITCAAIIVLGVIFSIVFPPFSNPDEVTHFRAAYRMANVILHRGTDPMMRADDFYFYDSVGESHLSDGYYGTLLDNFNFFALDPSLIPVESIGIFNPFGERTIQMTLPSALGLCLAQLVGFGAIPAIYVGRWVNLVCFAAFAFFSIRIIPQGKRVLAVVSLLPMTLHQAGSLSYDAPILGMAFLVFSLILRAIMSQGRLRNLEIAGILVWSVLLAPCKVVYAFMLVLVLFIPSNRFANKRQSILFKGLVFGLSIAYILLVRLSSMTYIATAQASEAGMRGYSLATIIEQPTWFLDIAVNTLFERSDFLLLSMLGYALGSLQEDLVLPVTYLLPFLIILCLASIRNKDETALTAGLRVTLIGIYCAVFAAVSITMLLAFTRVGFNVIEGVQGRYLLPVLPLLLFGIRGKNIIVQKDYSFSLVYCEVLMSAFIVCINFSKIIAL